VLQVLLRDPKNSFALAHLGLCKVLYRRDYKTGAPLIEQAILQNDDARVTGNPLMYHHGGSAFNRIGERSRVSVF